MFLTASILESFIACGKPLVFNKLSRKAMTDFSSSVISFLSINVALNCSCNFALFGESVFASAFSVAVCNLPFQSLLVFLSPNSKLVPYLKP